MRFSQHMRALVQAAAVVLALALPTMLAVSSADARIGGGFSSGSRGSRTFSAPPSTSTAPNAAQPFNRTFGQPAGPRTNTPMGGGFFNRPGSGLLGGLAASWWQRRQAGPAYAGAGAGALGAGAQPNLRTGMGFGLGSGSKPLEILPADYETFERLLVDLQSAWSNEDIGRLRTLATPEMVSYFERDLAQNRNRNVINKVSGTRLLQGDLAEAWREGDSDYASVAMRYSLVDTTVDRTTGRLVEGSEQPTEVTEVWTFVRPRGGSWELSAIQQTN
jgi:predicted lipid-binding transport protein (Tim44 family)